MEKIKGIAGPLPALRGGVWKGKLPLERSGKVGRTALVTTRMSLADTGQREVNQTERGSHSRVELKNKQQKKNVGLTETSRTVVPRGWRLGAWWAMVRGYGLPVLRRFWGAHYSIKTTVNDTYCVLDTC